MRTSLLAMVMLAASAPTWAVSNVTLHDIYQEHNGSALTDIIGFNMTLSDVDWLKPESGVDWDLYDKAQLTSLTLKIGPAQYQDFGLVVLQQDSSGHWRYVGRSTTWRTENQVAGRNSYTFYFDNLELDTDTQYGVFYYGHEASFKTLNENSFGGTDITDYHTASINHTADKPLISPTIIYVNDNVFDEVDGQLVKGEGVYFNNTDTATLTEIPYLTVTAQLIEKPYVPEPPLPNVPEPSTATLSLLALAGLAARRRR